MDEIWGRFGAISTAFDLRKLKCLTNGGYSNKQSFQTVRPHWAIIPCLFGLCWEGLVFHF